MLTYSKCVFFELSSKQFNITVLGLHISSPPHGAVCVREDSAL